MAFLGRIFRDRLFRRFLVASCFAGAFVWVAIDAFGVSEGVVLEFFVLSIVLVLAMVLAALPVALLMRLLRRKRDEWNMDASEEESARDKTGQEP